MKHRLLNLIAIFPLVVLIACAMLWICGLWYAYAVDFRWYSRDGDWDTSTYCRISSHHPGFHVFFSIEEAREKYPWFGDPTRISWEAYRSGRFGDGLWRDWRIHWRHRSSRLADKREYSYSLDLPYWLVLLFVTPLAGASAIRIIRKRRLRIRKKLGLCLCCGYDLRASPECCPKCGRSRIGSQHDE